MVIYSGFSTRRQQQKYNQLLKDLLHLLSQMVITYVESSKACSFRQSYEKVIGELSRMDQHKYSDIKVSVQVEPLTQHILYEDFLRQTFSQPPKKKEGRAAFRTKRSNADHLTAKTIDIAAQQPKEDKRRSLSHSSDKNGGRYQEEERAGLTMEQLMRNNPLIEHKLSGYRKKRYMQTRNNFPQIKEEDYQEERE